MVMTKKLDEIYMRLSRIFQAPMIMIGMKSGKTILKIFSIISPYHLAEVSLCPNETSWRSLWMVERQPRRLSTLVVLQDLCARYVQHLERPQFSNLIVECVEFLSGVRVILERMAVEDQQ